MTSHVNNMVFLLDYQFVFCLSRENLLNISFDIKRNHDDGKRNQKKTKQAAQKAD